MDIKKVSVNTCSILGRALRVKHPDVFRRVWSPDVITVFTASPLNEVLNELYEQNNGCAHVFLCRPL